MVFWRSKVIAIDIEQNKILDSINVNFANVIFVGNYIYSIQNEKKDLQSGLFIQSVSSFWDENLKKIDASNNFKLNSAIGGQNN